MQGEQKSFTPELCILILLDYAYLMLDLWCGITHTPRSNLSSEGVVPGPGGVAGEKPAVVTNFGISMFWQGKGRYGAGCCLFLR